MMTGAIVGFEGGHRFDLSHNMFVEPQVQLTYSRLRASSYSTDIRTVDLETMESLIARVGFMGGVKFNENKGATYLKASYNHDFLGDVDAKFSGVVDGNPIALGINDELDDNCGAKSRWVPATTLPIPYTRSLMSAPASVAILTRSGA